MVRGLAAEIAAPLSNSAEVGSTLLGVQSAASAEPLAGGSARKSPLGGVLNLPIDLVNNDLQTLPVERTLRNQPFRELQKGIASFFGSRSACVL